MAISAVGLKTQIWNNNIKSMVFLLLYPLVITAAYSLVFFALGAVVALLNPLPTGTVRLLRYIEYFMLYYWLIPYALILLFLACTYAYHRNRLDIAPGMRPITRRNHAVLYRLLENLCISRGLQVPYFFVQDHASSNAYTTGLTPTTYRIVVTSGLLETLSAEETECVLAHELTHMINGDTRLMFLTGSVTGLFRTLGNIVWPESTQETLALMNTEVGAGNGRYEARVGAARLCLGAVLRLANIGSLFAALFVSRKREYIADAGAVELTKNPEGLISALRKIEANSFGFYNAYEIKGSLFHYSNLDEITTHPAIADRIAAITYYNHLDSGQLPPWKKQALRRIKASVVAEEVW